jgi:ATP-dependent helicase/nuclease subunit B
MGELTLIHGPAHPDKGDLLYRRCLERIDQGWGDSFIYLLPSRWQAAQLRRRLLAESSSDLLACPFILGLDDFTRALYRLCPDRRALLPTPARRLFVEDALRQLSPTFTYFRQERTELFSGLAQALTRFVHELDAYGLSPEELETDLGHLPGLEGTKRDELLALFREYRLRLGSQWADHRDVLRSIDAHLDSTRFRRGFPDADLLLLSGFDSLSPLLRPILNRLFTLLPASIILLDFVPDRPRLFARLQPTFDFLRERATETVHFQPDSPDTPFSPLEPHLFTRSSASLAPPLHLFPCADRLAEVEEIARRIRLLQQTEEVPLNRICVCFRDLAPYASLVGEVFPRHGLPYHLSRGLPLARAPIIAGILAVLDAVLDRYSRSSLLRLLGLPWVSFTFDDEGQPGRLDAEFLEGWSRALRIYPGSSGWLQAVDGRCAYLESELDATGRGSSRADEIEDPEQWAAEHTEERAALRQLRTGLAALFAALAPLERQLDFATFRRCLLSALDQLGFYTHLRSHHSPNGSEIDGAPSETEGPPSGTEGIPSGTEGRAFQRFCLLLEELSGLAPFLRQRRFPLRLLAEKLRSPLGEIHLPPDPPRGVQVVTPDEAAGFPCDALFLGGLVEGEFPHFPTTDIFLEDRERDALGLEDIDTAVAADRLLFYRTLATPRHHLYLLYPRAEGGSALSPSSFVEEIEEFLDNTSPPERDESDAPLFTLSQLHATIGRGLGENISSSPAVTAAALTRQSRHLSSLASPLQRLLHGLSIEAARSRFDALGPYEGFLDHPRALAAVHSRLGSGHPFSATQLETYARCPFLFFAQRLLSINPLHDPDADESALERGNLIHNALYHFFSERVHDGSFDRITPDNLEAARPRLRAITRREADDLGLQGFFWEQELERLLGREDGEGREGLLMRFLRLESEATDPADPAHFELSFGSYHDMGPNDPLSTSTPYVISGPEEEDSVRLFGKIDRVDRTPDGRFAIYDYKTGQVPSVADIGRGLHLQIPLYLLAAENLLHDQGLIQGTAGAYYQLRDLENCGRKGLFGDKSQRGQVYSGQGRGLPEPEIFRQLIEQTRDFALSYARSMRRGLFHVTRQNPAKACTYCAYRQTCRLDHRRMRTLEREGKLS